MSGQRRTGWLWETVAVVIVVFLIALALVPNGRPPSEAARLAEGIEAGCRSAGVAAVVNRVGSMLTIFFTGKAVTDIDTPMNSAKLVNVTSSVASLG